MCITTDVLAQRACTTVFAPAVVLIFKMPIVVFDRLESCNRINSRLNGITTANGDTVLTLRDRLNKELCWLCFELVPVIGSIFSQFSNYKLEEKLQSEDSDYKRQPDNCIRIAIGERMLEIENLKLKLEEIQRIRNSQPPAQKLTHTPPAKDTSLARVKEVRHSTKQTFSPKKEEELRKAASALATAEHLKLKLEENQRIRDSQPPAQKTELPHTPPTKDTSLDQVQQERCEHWVQTLPLEQEKELRRAISALVMDVQTPNGKTERRQTEC